MNGCAGGRSGRVSDFVSGAGAGARVVGGGKSVERSGSCSAGAAFAGSSEAEIASSVTAGAGLSVPSSEADATCDGEHRSRTRFAAHDPEPLVTGAAPIRRVELMLPDVALTLTNR